MKDLSISWTLKKAVIGRTRFHLFGSKASASGITVFESFLTYFIRMLTLKTVKESICHPSVLCDPKRK